MNPSTTKPIIANKIVPNKSLKNSSFSLLLDIKNPIINRTTSMEPIINGVIYKLNIMIICLVKYKKSRHLKK